MAVRKPCGLKKPVIQKQMGLPWKSHRRNCESRSSNSVNQKPNVLEGQEICNKKLFFYKKYIQSPCRDLDNI